MFPDIFSLLHGLLVLAINSQTLVVSTSTFTDATRPGRNGKDLERVWGVLMAETSGAEVGRHFGVVGRHFNVSQEDFDRQVRLPTVPGQPHCGKHPPWDCGWPQASVPSPWALEPIFCYQLETLLSAE